eukprot:1145285-Pelagomonas_calceolata.AAC.2
MGSCTPWVTPSAEPTWAHALHGLIPSAEPRCRRGLGSASRDMPASLNQWAAGTGAPMGSSSAGPGCRQPRQQQPSQPFLSGSPGGLGNALGSPLVGARCSSYMELSRDADEVTALSYFSRGEFQGSASTPCEDAK